MSLASEKQIVYFKKLYPKWEQIKKQNQELYNKDSITTFILRVKKGLEDKEEVQGKHISIAIKDMKDYL